jgi:iron complex outermembrane recepter protein
MKAHLDGTRKGARLLGGCVDGGMGAAVPALRGSMRTVRLSTCIVSAALVVSTVTVRAEAPELPTQASDNALEEVIVTANKREENINKVGLTITAFTADALQERQITNPQELAADVPGMQLAASTHSTPVYTLRGVGYNGDALAVYPAVSIYMDQAPMPFPVLAGHSHYDLERVEVLKGPQGTLFGQNSTGGAINYIAAKPTQTFSAGANVSYGNFNLIQATGFASGPLTEGLTARVAFDVLHRDDWQYSTSRTDSLGQQQYYAGRFILDWKPTSGLSVALNVNGSVDRSDPQAVQLIAVLPTNPSAPSVAEKTVPLATRNLRAADWSTGAARPKGDRNLLQASLRVDYDLSSSASITSLTTYNWLQQSPVFDVDGSAYQLVDFPQDIGRISAVNQELRISNANERDATFRWTFGGNYDKSTVFEDQRDAYRDNSLSSAANLYIDTGGINSQADIKNSAAFANGELDVLEKLTVRAGARYTKSVNDTRICDYSGDDRTAQLFTILGQLIGGRTIPLGPNDCYSLNEKFLPGTPFVSTLSEHNVSWKVGSDYRVNEENLLYVNISRGFKAGSFPAIPAALQKALIPARQEKVTAYETGIKSRILNGAIQTNAAVFYQDYADKQIQGTFKDPLFGLLQQLQNVPQSHIAGAEADVTVRPLRGLVLSGSASYLQTRVDRYTGTDSYGTDRNFKGDALPFAPKWTLVFNGDYSFPVHIAGDGELFVGASANHRGKQDAYIGASQIPIPSSANARSLSSYPLVIDDYTTVDARIGYRSPGDTFSLTIWGKNVFNAFNILNIVSNNDVVVRQVGQPTTYGISFGYKWQ